jgi:hypothetical protein
VVWALLLFVLPAKDYARKGGALRRVPAAGIFMLLCGNSGLPLINQKPFKFVSAALHRQL